MDVKRKVEQFWVAAMEKAGIKHVFGGKAENNLDDQVTPFVVCRCEKAPSLLRGSPAHRIDPFEVLVISHINEQNSEEHSNTLAEVRTAIEYLDLPSIADGIDILGIGPVTLSDVVSEDEERYADIITFAMGVILK